MSKRPFTKTYEASDKTVSPDVTPASSGMVSEKEIVSQLRSQLEMAHQELKYAAREIHDNLGHLANLAHIHLKLLAEMPIDSAHQDKVNEISSLVSELNQEIKHLSISLTESGSPLIALDKLLVKEVHRIRRLDLFKLVYLEPTHWPSLQPLKTTVLFRMVQEILNNILKHSQASLVKIEVSCTRSYMNFHLEDDGVGYDPTAKTENPHLGINHLYERARVINAQLQVNSAQDKGTSIHIRMPIT